MNLTRTSDSLQSIALSHRPQDILLEEQLEKLEPIIKKMQKLSEKKFSNMAVPMAKHLLKEFKEQSYQKSILEILAAPTYVGLLGVGGLASIASINLLVNANYSSILSSDIDTRVTTANNMTNVGALFAFFTDIPAITYMLYLLGLSKAYREAVQEILDKSYHACINDEWEDFTLTADLRELLYLCHISKLQSLGVDRFYLNPDIHSQTGAIYKLLAPTLEKIDQEIKEGLSIKDLGKSCIKTFKQESYPKKLAKITATFVSILTIGLAGFLFLENGILLANTPVGDLFSSDETKQTNEALLVSQEGGIFSSLTAAGVAIWIAHRLLIQAAYNKAMREKINACFAKNSPNNLSTEMRNALFKIKQTKLRAYEA